MNSRCVFVLWFVVESRVIIYSYTYQISFLLHTGMSVRPIDYYAECKQTTYHLEGGGRASLFTFGVINWTDIPVEYTEYRV